MKIKTVCELTGLSDRTIRYYIEEKLIYPSFTENYLGRKSFDFSDENIDEVKNIAVLRKFDFTIGEIREIINDANNSKPVIQTVKIRNEQAIVHAQFRQSVLSQIEDDRVYTIAELANELSKASINIPQTEETTKKSLRKIVLSTIQTTLTFLIVWLPVALQILFFVVTNMVYIYPRFYPGAIVYMVLSVVPSLLVVLVNKINRNWKKRTRILLLLLCLVSLLCAFVVLRLSAGMMAKSETTDFRDYREFDAECFANRDLLLQEFFPTWPHYFEDIKLSDENYETVYLDAHYFYRYISIFDYTYDVYAEWPLNTESFDKEVTRVSELFDRHASSMKYLKIEKGNYNCLILYDGDMVFEEATNSYKYYIFAYDTDILKVRYICCCSLENGADQPYYLTLDWYS